MRILYVAPVRLGSRTGDTEHVVNVCRHLAALGVTLDLVAIDGNSYGTNVAEDPGLALHGVDDSPKPLRRLRNVAARARELADTTSPDLVYVRPFPLAWLLLLRHLDRTGLPYVLELNAMTAAEYRSKGQPLKGRVFEWFDGRALRRAAGIVTVTHEIGDWALRLAGAGKPALVAGNGVDVERVPMPADGARQRTRSRLGLRPESLVMAMAGFASPWHGADRAVAMLKHLEADAELWLIGAEKPDAAAGPMAVARVLGVHQRVRVFPRLGPEPLAELLAAADIGLGPLAFDRSGLREAQPIKVRHYLATGLPVLYNHLDPKLDPTSPFLSHVPSREPRDLAKGVEKLRAVRPTHAQAARAFAAEHLSWAAVADETRVFLTGLLTAPDR